MNYKIGIIGTGNMGYPMLSGAVKAFGVENVTFYEKNNEKTQYVINQTGCKTSASISELVADCSCVLLAVKPQFLDEVLEEVKKTFTIDKLIISICAGRTIAYLQEKLGDNTRIVRAMPNLPASVGEGMTAVTYSHDDFTEEEKSIPDGLFNAVGKYVIIPEKLINASVCANGSSPAYIFMLIEALADGVVKYGIPRKTAYELVAQTVLGSAKMVLETGIHPGELKDMVCSPGGTTIEGVSALEEYGFRNSIIKACDACYEKNNNIK